MKETSGILKRVFRITLRGGALLIAFFTAYFYSGHTNSQHNQYLFSDHSLSLGEEVYADAPDPGCASSDSCGSCDTCGAGGGDG